MKKTHFITLLSVLLIITVSHAPAAIWPRKKAKAQEAPETARLTTKPGPSQRTEPLNLTLFKASYPELTFTTEYDEEVSDWRVSFSSYNKDYTFYWQDSRMLPQSELKNSESYWPLLYTYPLELLDPQDFTQEQIERMKNFGSSENRRNTAGTPMFFFDALYDSNTRGSLESHLARTTFLGKKTTVHQRITEPLKKAEERILEVSKTDSEVKEFISEIKSADAYYWRIISGTNRKSFHSLGIAVDILPSKLGGKAIFWSWTKDNDPEGWMLTPLNRRWMPPQKVIDIMEEEGFIWGGKWIIFDNMHFEYHPELIKFARAVSKA